MVTTAIVEDEALAFEKLKKYFDMYEKENGEQFDVHRFSDAESFLEGYSDRFDLVMMDIEMPGINGMEAAKRLREMDREVALVFVTNMANYAVKGYEVDALDFIVKPVKYADFSFKLKRVMRSLSLREQDTITVSLSSGIKRIALSELLYVEVTGHNVIYHMVDEELKTRGTLAKTEEMLAGSSFMKCNNCYLVNPKHIKEVKGYTVTVGEDELAISRPRKKAFMQELNAWIAGGGR